jgi:KaiC/GvpD/RAD55 family RecA-like ATPase
MFIPDNSARCRSGVPGLDDILGGGFPRGRCILVRGDCGTGKTILGAQFINNGIVQYKEPGVLVLLEQNAAHFKKDMFAFGFDIQSLQESGQLVLIDASLSRVNLEKTSASEAYLHNTPKTPFCVSDVVDYVVAAAKEIGATRVSIDNLPALDNLLKKVETSRDDILYMSGKLRSIGLTSLLLCDNLKTRIDDTENYVSDGVISMEYQYSGPDMGRRLVVQKMRGTKHSEHIHPMKISKGVGIEVFDSGV